MKLKDGALMLKDGALILVALVAMALLLLWDALAQFWRARRRVLPTGPNSREPVTERVVVVLRKG